jgi:hypothetical protein
MSGERPGSPLSSSFAEARNVVAGLEVSAEIVVKGLGTAPVGCLVHLAYEEEKWNQFVGEVFRVEPIGHARTYAFGEAEFADETLYLAAHVERRGELSRNAPQPLSRIVDFLDVKFRGAHDGRGWVVAASDAQGQRECEP